MRLFGIFLIISVFATAFAAFTSNTNFQYTYSPSGNLNPNDKRINFLNKEVDCKCETIDPVTVRMIGKESLKRYPWMVSIQDKNKNVLCGGIILNKKQILTARQCVGYHRTKIHYTDIVIIAGTTDNNFKNWVDRGYHSRRNSQKYQYSLEHNYETYGSFYSKRKPSEPGDLAIIRIRGTFDFTDPNLKPACFDSAIRDFNPADVLVATGLGFTKKRTETFQNGRNNNQDSSKLMEANFEYISPATRTLAFEPECLYYHLICTLPAKKKSVTDFTRSGSTVAKPVTSGSSVSDPTQKFATEIDAESRLENSICHGDVGGPLHYTQPATNGAKSKVLVVGLSSFFGGRINNLTGEKESCVGPNFFVRITYYKRFLDQKIKPYNMCWM